MPTTYGARVSALAAQIDLLLSAFTSAESSAPSRVQGWTVADLERHLALVLDSLGTLATGPATPGPATGLAGWAAALPGLAGTLDEVTRTASPPPLPQAAGRLASVLPSADGARLVRQRTGTHTLADAVLFRLIETVVHGLDLPEPVTPDRRAGRLVVQALAGLLAERAPGRTVEVRVPPYAAVQCLDGPRHTRGTPPNTVETDPVTFLRLATGRLAWDEARPLVRASGERAALVADLLPLLH